jgi:CRISPR-associated protein Cmr1
VHETGIIGSLRWWYEAVVRGLGGRICNPTSKQHSERCNFDAQAYERSSVESQQERLHEAGICNVCQLFGATGWSRRFRFEVDGGEPLFALQPNDRVRITAPGGKRGWYFGCPYVSTNDSPIYSYVYPLRGEHIINELAIVAALVSRWGGLGAKTQHGWGVVSITLQDEQNNEFFTDVDQFLDGFGGDSQADRGLPSLGNMFFVRLYLQKDIKDNWWQHAKLGTGATDSRWGLNTGHSVPIAPAVKYKLRFGGTRPDGKRPAPILPEVSTYLRERHFFGHVGQPNRTSMFDISNAYKHDGRWQFRLWGWFPEEGNSQGIDRDQLMAELHQLVTSDTAFWTENFGPSVVDLSQTEWREVDRSGHGRNGSSIATPPTTTADLLRHLLTEKGSRE